MKTIILRTCLVLILCTIGLFGIVTGAGTVHAQSRMSGDPPPPTNGASYVLPANGGPTNGASYVLPANGGPTNGPPDTGTATNGPPDTGPATNGPPSTGAGTNGAP